MDEQRGQTGAGLANLAQGAVQDIEQLLSQHLDLLRAEVKQELGNIREAALSLTAGAGATAAGGILGTLAAVHLLHRLSGMPLWLCYAITGGGMGLQGSGLICTGVKQASKVDLVPKQTVQTIKEELTGSNA